MADTAYSSKIDMLEMWEISRLPNTAIVPWS